MFPIFRRNWTTDKWRSTGGYVSGLHHGHISLKLNEPGAMMVEDGPWKVTTVGFYFGSWLCFSESCQLQQQKKSHVTSLDSKIIFHQVSATRPHAWVNDKDVFLMLSLYTWDYTSSLQWWKINVLLFSSLQFLVSLNRSMLGIKMIKKKKIVKYQQTFTEENPDSEFCVRWI